MTGLGLAVVAGIVRQNAGTIQIESALGQGTAVRIHLPRWTRPAPPQAVAGPLAAGLPSCTVLLVEDEEPVRNVTRRGLERAGFRVVSFGDPVEALAHVARDPGAIDLLITDVMMPGLTGKQLVDRMAVLQPGRRSLFVSAYPADVIAQQGVVDADIDLLQKPYPLAELASRVRRMLESPG
jgi:CheY-like chemotaxis protein